MQIECDLAGDVMGDDGFVHVDGPLRSSRGAAGEMQQRHVFGTCPYRTECIRGGRQGAGEIHRTGWRGAGAIGEKYVIKAGKLFAPRLHLAAIKRFGGDERLGIADAHAGLDRLGSERRKQGREHAAVLERAKRGDVELGRPAEQRKNAISLADPALGKDVGEPVRRSSQRGIAEIANAFVAADPAQRKLVAAAAQDMSVKRLMGDIEPAAGQSVEQRASLRPREPSGVLLVIRQVGAGIIFRPFADSLPFHVSLALIEGRQGRLHTGSTKDLMRIKYKAFGARRKPHSANSGISRSSDSGHILAALTKIKTSGGRICENAARKLLWETGAMALFMITCSSNWP